MAPSSFVRTSFLGGEWSQVMQGRYDRPDYAAALNHCTNSMPMEQGAWTRRPGTRYAGSTRHGLPGRLIAFDFKQASPYSMEFTDGFLRFRNSFNLVTTNDRQSISSITATTPAEFTTGGNHGWSNNDQVIFPVVGATSTLLLNRQFAIIATAANKFTLFDAVTGSPIDGSTLAGGAGVVDRILQIATPYAGGQWDSLRAIQADLPTIDGTAPGAVLLRAGIKPYVLTVTAQPTATTFATFDLSVADFQDGPYFNPVGHGAQATPSATIGVINITLSFNAYDAARAYAKGEYVTYSSVNYRSLINANVGHQPDISPTQWVAVSAGEVIGTHGFQVSDIGRHIRLFSEPSIWASGTTYSAGAVVAYGGAGLDYAGATYWKSLVGSNTGNVPGVDLTKWVLFPSGAIWTWGRITGLSNIIASGTGSAMGNMTGGGGVAAAFDGIFVKGQASSSTATSGLLTGTSTFTSYVGKDFSAATDQKVAQATVYPATEGLATTISGPANVNSITLNLRGSATPPASSSDGTLLGTVTTPNTTVPQNIISGDQSTAWKYLWIEQITSITVLGGTAQAINIIAQVTFINPTGTGVGTGVSVEIRGDALLYTTPIRTWRLGIFSDTTGYPTCGTWHEGRLWLSGYIPNRIDSSRSNDPFNFAPTNPDGSVPANAAISYTFNAPDVNPIFWMVPDQQGILCGTQKGEWLVQATSNNLPLTPTTIQAHRNTTYACANIEPRRTNLTLAVVQAFKHDLLEYFADVYSGKFSAKDLAFTGKHLVASGIEEIAWQQETNPILWVRCADGSLSGCTYGRSSLVSSQPPDYAAWHPHVIGLGDRILSICVAGNQDGTLDALTFVAADSAGTCRVEMLTNFFTETTNEGSAWFLDSAVAVPSSVPLDTPIAGAPYGGVTLNGLWPLNGRVVSVFAAGLDVGQGELGTAPASYTVSNGSIFVPYGDGLSAGSGQGGFTADFAANALAAGQIVVGFLYQSNGQIVRPNTPAETGARIGPAFGKLRRVQKYAIQVVKTMGLSIGGNSSKLNPILFKDATGNVPARGQTFTGIYKDTLQDDYSLDSGMLYWTISRPLPATITAIGGFMQAQDET